MLLYGQDDEMTIRGIGFGQRRTRQMTTDTAAVRQYRQAHAERVIRSKTDDYGDDVLVSHTDKQMGGGGSLIQCGREVWAADVAILLRVDLALGQTYWRDLVSTI